MGVDRQLPPKREVALALLEASMVAVYLDPRGDDVHVPPWFKKQPQLMLQIGLNMPVPIPDLDVGEEALSCTLSFNRRPEFCRIPWSSIYALVGEDGRGMVWPDDVPPEVAGQAQGRAAAAKARSHLRAVPDAEEEQAPEAEAKPEPPKPAAPKQVAPKQAARKAAAQETTTGSTPAAEKRRKKAAERASKKATPDPAPKPSIPDASAAGAKKGKRELPSYLRVVK